MKGMAVWVPWEEHGAESQPVSQLCWDRMIYQKGVKDKGGVSKRNIQDDARETKGWAGTARGVGRGGRSWKSQRGI